MIIFVRIIFIAIIIFCLNACSENTKTAEGNVKSYLKASDTESRVEFVLPNQTKYLYQRYGDTEFNNKNIKVTSNCGNELNVGDECSVEASWKVKKEKIQYVYYNVLTENGWKIDWIRSIGWNTISLDVMKLNKSKTYLVYASSCAVDDYFNYGFTDSHFISLALDIDTPEIQTDVGWLAPKANKKLINKIIEALGSGPINCTVLIGFDGNNQKVLIDFEPEYVNLKE